MYLGKDFSPQESGESEVFGMDFVNDLDAMEQILSSVWTISVSQGNDPNPKVHLEGTSLAIVPFGSNLKTATVQRIGGLWPDVTYIVRAQILTDAGNTRSLWSHVRGVDLD
jgi:hypothetical protein